MNIRDAPAIEPRIHRALGKRLIFGRRDPAHASLRVAVRRGSRENSFCEICPCRITTRGHVENAAQIGTGATGKIACDLQDTGGNFESAGRISDLVGNHRHFIPLAVL